MSGRRGLPDGAAAGARGIVARAARRSMRRADDVAADSGDNVLFRASRRPGAGPKQLYKIDSVRKIAEKYGIDISEMDISLGDVKYRGFQGFTGPDMRTTLFVPAFRSEEDLARTLQHELYHLRDLKSGKPFPMSEAAKEPWEDRAYAHEQEWWDNQPIRPEPRRP